MAVVEKLHIDNKTFWVDEESQIHIEHEAHNVKTKLDRLESIDLLNGLITMMQNAEQDRKKQSLNKKLKEFWPWKK